MTLADAKDLATIIGVVAAFATLVKGLWEYSSTTVLRRAEYFAKMKREFLADDEFAKLTVLLQTERAAQERGERDDPGFAEIESRDKERYLCFFEEVALLLRARLIRDELACYMFGYYALLCDRSNWFWSPSFPKDKDYWPLFFAFVKEMEKVERSKHRDRAAFAEKIRA